LFGTLQDDEIREELSGDPNDACEHLVKKVIAVNKPHQDNVTVAILACGEKEPVTVKRKSIVMDKIYRPHPVEKRRKPRLLGFLGVVLVVLCVAGIFLIWKRNPEPTKPAAPVFKAQSSSRSDQKVIVPTLQRGNDKRAGEWER